MVGGGPAYVLGHSDRELSRLTAQARLLEPATRQFLSEAGIAEGMRVLDIGSGAGDVAFLVAQLVGPGGEVVGSDRAAAAVAVARRRAREMRLDNVSFCEGDPSQLAFDRPFDAVVGRYVLLFQPDPAAMLRGVARHLRPGGLVVMHEPDWLAARSMPSAPTYDRCCQWLQDAFRLAGTDTNMAHRLYAAFVSAGLGMPELRMRTFIGGGAGCREFLAATADLIEALAPTLERLGIVTRAEIGPATLARRLIAEAGASGSIIIGRSEIGAWARL